MTVNTTTKVCKSEDPLFHVLFMGSFGFPRGLSSDTFPVSLFHISTELGDGPFSLVSAVHNDTMFGVNRTSSSVFPLTRERPGQLPAPGLLFNFMITEGLWKDRMSREHPHLCWNTPTLLVVSVNQNEFSSPVFRRSRRVTGVRRETKLFSRGVGPQPPSVGAVEPRGRVRSSGDLCAAPGAVSARLHLVRTRQPTWNLSDAHTHCCSSPEVRQLRGLQGQQQLHPGGWEDEHFPITCTLTATRCIAWCQRVSVNTS